MIGRIPIVDVRPAVDGGRRPAKAVVGETFEVSATVFGEGHDAIGANVVLLDPQGRPGPWTPMRELEPGTDRWVAEVTPRSVGKWAYLVEAWSDPVTTWRHSARIKVPSRIDVALVLEEGADLYERAAEGVPEGPQRNVIRAAVRALRDESRSAVARLAVAVAPEVVGVLECWPLRELVSSSGVLP
ncbi:maltotransferase domain-containing protein, partial [Streptomyces sp. NPDC001020]